MKVTNRLFFIVLFLGMISFSWAYSQIDLSPRKAINGKYGYIDKSESFVISPKYDKAFSFEDNIARVIVKGKWGLIDNTGKFIVKAKLEYIGWSNDGYFQWNKENLSLTNTLVPPINTFYPSVNGVIGYLTEGHWGLISSSGRLIKNEWDSLSFGDGAHFGVYKKELGWSWVDENNKGQDEIFFDEILPLSNGLIAGRNHTESGYRLYDFVGQQQTDSIYKHVASLNTDYIKARNTFLWYQLGKNGHVVKGKAFEEIKYVQANNTMQYMPFSPWMKSNADFKELLNFNYQIEYEVQNGLFVIGKEDEKYLWNSLLDKKLQINYGDSVFLENTFIVIQNKREDSFHLLTSALQKLANSYREILILDSSKFMVMLHLNSEWTLWDIPNNSKVISNISADIYQISDHEFKLKREEKYGIYDIRKAEWILEPLYDNVMRLNDTLVASSNSDSINFYGQNGFHATLYSIIEVLSINDSVVAVMDSTRKWSLRNIELKKVLEEEFLGIALTSGNTIRLKNADGWMLYNLQFKKLVLRNSYDSISDNQHGYFIVNNDKKFGIIDTNGNFTFQMSNYYRSISAFGTRRWQVYRNGLSGIVDQNGILKISTQYEDFKVPVYGYIPFKFRGKWGLLDQKERFVLQPLNDHQDIISEEFVQVWKNGLSGVKNINDKILIPLNYESIRRNQFGSFIVNKGDKWGFYNLEAQQIRPSSYDAIKQLNKDLIALKKNRYWQLINSKGNLVSDKKFKEIYFDSNSKKLFFKETKSWIITSLD